MDKVTCSTGPYILQSNFVTQDQSPRIEVGCRPSSMAMKRIEQYNTLMLYVTIQNLMQFS